MRGTGWKTNRKINWLLKFASKKESIGSNIFLNVVGNIALLSKKEDTIFVFMDHRTFGGLGQESKYDIHFCHKTYCPLASILSLITRMKKTMKVNNCSIMSYYIDTYPMFRKIRDDRIWTGIINQCDKDIADNKGRYILIKVNKKCHNR